MYKRLDERKLDCEWLAPCRVPVWCLPRPSRSMHVKNLRSGEGKCRRGKERKKVELADLLSFGE